MVERKKDREIERIQIYKELEVEKVRYSINSFMNVNFLIYDFVVDYIC